MSSLGRYKFLNIQELSNLTQEETDDLNSLILLNQLSPPSSQKNKNKLLA